MATKATVYTREIRQLDGKTIVQIGKRVKGGWRQSCTTLPDSFVEARELIGQWKIDPGSPHCRGSGDEYIAHNLCELHYYLDGKKLRVLKP